jgi:hypothetical protein
MRLRVILFCLAASMLHAADAPHARLDDKHRVFFKDYCIECHNEKKQKGKLRLDDISFALDSVENADRWQKILNQINSGEMPPEDSKQPERVAKTEFLDSLSHTLMAARRSLGDSGGMITMRRLNRREYKNTLRDLLGVDINVRELPADGGAGTFDTVGSSLFMSSDQFEQYLALGRQALDEHFARAAVIAPKSSIQHVEAEEWANKQAKQFADMYQEGFDRWKAWQASGGKPPTDFKFSDAGAAEFAKVQFERHWPYFDLYQKLPLVKQGAYLTIYDITTHVEINGDPKLPVGDYVLRLRVGAVPGTPKSRHVIEVGHKGERKGEFTILSTHEIIGTTDQPQILEIPVHLTPTSNRRFAIREKQPMDPHAVFDMWNETRLKNGTGPTPCIWIDWVELEGPAGAQPVASAAANTKPKRIHIETEEKNGKIAKSLADRTDAHQRYEKWTAAVDAAAQKAENTEVAEKIRAEKKGDDRHFYSQWQRIKGAPSPKDFGFVDEIQADEQGRRDWVHSVPYQRAYLEHPATKTGTFLTIEDVFVNPYQPFRLPGNWPAGDYVVRVRIAATSNTPATRHFVEFGSQHDSGVRAVASSHQVTGTMEKPQVLEIPLKFSPAKGFGFFFQEKGTYESEDVAHRLFAEGLKANGIGPEFALWIDWIEVESVEAPILAATKTIIERREVEDHANRMVGGTYNGYFKGGYEAAKEFLATGKPQKGIPDEGEAKFRVHAFEQHGPSFERYLNDPLTKTGAYLTIYNVHPDEVITLPPDQPSGWMKTKHELEKAEPGDYMLRLRIGAVKGTPKERHFVELGTRKDKDDFGLMQTLQISGTTDTPQIIEVPVSLTADGPRTFVLREKRDVKLDFELYETARKAAGVGPESALWIDWVEWEGPLTKTNKQSSLNPVLFANTTNASEHDYARAIIEKFAIRAFREKAPKPDYIDKLVKLFDSRVKAGDKFDVAIKTPLSVVLASPRFLYLSEPAVEKKPRPLTGAELATRLSYFLWSAPPDDQLLIADLSKPDVLAHEVDRMIASRKADEFVSGFVHQWLGMERLDFFQFDTKQFRDFDESAKAASRREVYETFAQLMRANGSARDLLKSDYVIVNGLLATYYGIDGVSGDEFRKVSLPKDSPRGGLLGMAAVLAMGSNGERSSPVERGAWVLRKLLHEPPPPAPPNVPQITRLNGQALTTRERLLAHQEQPQCASCHRAIDPIGFGLENFNAAGKWRTEDSFQAVDANGKPNPKLIKTWTIDPAAVFHKGPAFKDYFELRDLIAAKPESFARGLTEALIQYALGRPFGFTDEELATTIVQRSQKKDFAMREFVQSLVASKEFHTK